MSADNFTYVGKTNDTDFGIWTNCSASSEDYPTSKPEVVFQSPVMAIIHAHRYEKDNPTEYGVALGKGVLEAAESLVDRLILIGGS